jgi:hypothetical protein
VDIDNHLRGALKYILLSLPSPSEKPQSRERDEIIREAFATGNHGFNYATKNGRSAREEEEEDEFWTLRALVVRKPNPALEVGRVSTVLR